MSLFVDTSVWFAAADAGDSNHLAAARILKSGESFLITDHILVEASRLLAHRLGWRAAEEFAKEILAGASDVEIVRFEDLEMALSIGQDYPDQDFSLVDRTSFVVMQRLGVLRVATFDRHFAVYRFGHDRRQAFTVVR